VIDTSVLVADPESMFSFGTLDVVVPLTVLEELDELKTRPDDVGRSARTAVRSLEELRLANGGILSESVRLPGGGTLRIELNGARLERLAELHLDKRKPDNRILATALTLAESPGGALLISADGSLRVKAAALGIPASDYARTLGGSRHSVGTMATVEVTADVISLLFADHHVSIEEVEASTGTSVSPVANGATVLSCGSQSVLCRRRGDTLIKIRSDLSAWGLRPRSKEQFLALDLLMDSTIPVVSLEGHAGTGKTLLALAAGLEQVFEATAGAHYSRMMILRPVIAVGRQELGFLPGDREEKLGPWFEAIVDAMVALGDRVSHRQAKSTLDGWVADGRLVMDAVTYLRGRSLQDTWIIVDECQNLETSTAKTVLTRLGEGSKIALVGDVTQIDSPFLSQRTNALAVLGDTFADSPLFAHVTLRRGERSAVADLAAARL